MTKKKMQVDDVTMPDQPTKRRYKKSTMQSTKTVNPQDRFSQLEPIPASATNDPVAYARDHAKSLIPYSVKELEWQLKFGDAKTRKEIALQFMAFEGVSDKGPQVGQVVPAINLILPGGLPWSQIDQPKQLDEGAKTATVDGIIIDKETLEKPK